MRYRLMCCAAAVMLLTCGCGREEKASLGFEKRLEAAALSANYRDTGSYLSCWLPQEKERYINSGDGNEHILDDIFAGTDVTGRLVFKMTDSTELSEDRIAALEDKALEEYGTRLSFSKARRANVEIRLNSSKEVLTDVREMTLVRYEGSWYIFGEVIDSFSFAGS